MMMTKLSLQKRMIVFITVVTIVLLSAIFIFDTHLLRLSVEEAYVSQIKGITTAINGRYEESHSIEDVQQIFDYIHYKNEDVIDLRLYNMDGVILASSNRNVIGGNSYSKMVKEIHMNRTIVTHIKNDRDGIPKVRLIEPLKEDGVTIGAIQLLLDTSFESILVKRRTISIIIFGSAISVILLIILSLIIRRLFIIPLKLLRKAAYLVKTGQEYEKITLNTSREMNEVAEAFNEMMDNLQERQEKLVESEKMVALGNLVAGVSHEINTPIGIGVTAVSFLDQKTDEFMRLYKENTMKRSDFDHFLSTVNETVGIIQSNLNRASELIKSFKQVAVDQSNELKRRFNVKEYINEVITSLGPSLKKTTIEVSITGNGSVELYSYPGGFSQVITNLVMNSLIHAYESDHKGTIWIHISSIGKHVRIRYTDDGKGMSEEIAERIFEPFFTTRRGGGGTGLGMHIVYNIVTQSLGGTISCESTVGQGTTFIIEVPITEII